MTPEVSVALAAGAPAALAVVDPTAVAPPAEIMKETAVEGTTQSL
jgi:hypothetical protein